MTPEDADLARVHVAFVAHQPCAQCHEVFYRQPRPSGATGALEPCPTLRNILDAIRPGIEIRRMATGIFTERKEAPHD